MPVISVAEFKTEDDLNRVIDKLDDADFFGKRLRVRRVSEAGWPCKEGSVRDRD